MPTRFLVNARYLYAQQPRIFSPEIIDLRLRLSSTRVDIIGFLSWSNNHYSAYVLDGENLSYSNSLGLSPNQIDVDVLRWVFADIVACSMTSVQQVDGPRQNVTGVGSGSCGIAAHDFVASYFGISTTGRWTSLRSAEMRDQALHDLLRYHMVTSRMVIVRFL